MIVSTAPLRITLGGGGSDLHEDGLCVTATINHYVSVAVTPIFTDDYSIRYSHQERVGTIGQVKHPIIRAALDHYSVQPGVEITSFADIPAGTGLGSSGAFAVAICHALARHTRRRVRNLARTACKVDPIGWQDQYSATYGGLNAYQFGELPKPVHIDSETIAALNDQLVLFYTGTTRASADVLPVAVTDPDECRAIALTSIRALELGDMRAFAETLTAQWELKYEAHPSEVHRKADFTIRDTIERGAALGGKLVGAGDGGFILFYTTRPESLRRHVTLREVTFALEPYGVR